MKDVSENVNEQIEYAIGHCKVALDQLRKLVVEKGVSRHRVRYPVV